MEIVAQNISRLNHLLTLFGLSKVDLLSLLNQSRSKRPLTENDVFSINVKTSTLAKVDKIFCKGLAFYLNPSELPETKEESIFFRKDDFNASLNLTAKRMVNKFEEDKLEVDTLLKLSDISKARQLPVYNVSQDAQGAALDVRKKIYPKDRYNDKDFLKKLIGNLADYNVLVFEFVESHNQKEKANINGFFLAPDVIVLKWQKYTKREIFTLAHEIGHYILNEEEIDDKIGFETLDINLNAVEQWCNEFAFAFLIGDEYGKLLQNLVAGNERNNYHYETVEKIYSQSHVSKLAIYTNLLYSNKITRPVYNHISDDIKTAIILHEAEEKTKFEKEKIEADRKGEKLIIPAPKAIISPFYLNTLQTALYNGLVDEFEFCERLKIKPEKLEAYLA